jgi:hypothetical protein
LVLVVEGLAYALAPSFIRRMAEQFPGWPMNSCAFSASPRWRSASGRYIWRSICERSRDCAGRALDLPEQRHILLYVGPDG